SGRAACVSPGQVFGFLGLVLACAGPARPTKTDLTAATALPASGVPDRRSSGSRGHGSVLCRELLHFFREKSPPRPAQMKCRLTLVEVLPAVAAVESIGTGYETGLSMRASWILALATGLACFGCNLHGGDSCCMAGAEGSRSQDGANGPERPGHHLGNNDGVGLARNAAKRRLALGRA
uniref:Secreted protein n=1 Tax=Macrostomum lignano TaxID=282301 RepID=A0A1I8JPB1_9PLAT